MSFIFKCNTCFNTFKFKNILDKKKFMSQHMVKCFKKKFNRICCQIELETIKSKKRGKFFFECPHCDFCKNCSSEDDLDNTRSDHILNIHILKKKLKYPFECMLCNKVFEFDDKKTLKWFKLQHLVNDHKDDYVDWEKSLRSFSVNYTQKVLECNLCDCSLKLSNCEIKNKKTILRHYEYKHRNNISYVMQSWRRVELLADQNNNDEWVVLGVTPFNIFKNLRKIGEHYYVIVDKHEHILNFQYKRSINNKKYNKKLNNVQDCVKISKKISRDKIHNILLDRYTPGNLIFYDYIINDDVSESRNKDKDLVSNVYWYRKTLYN